MTTTDHTELTAAVAAPRAAKAIRRDRPKLKDTWWRHAVAITAMVIALFPVVYTLSSAFNRDNSLQGATLVPTHVTLHNFGNLLHNNVTLKSGGKTDAPYLRWVFNSMVIAGTTALLTTLLGALAAYAFSRFRFKGRRFGMIALLLIQVFPQFLAVVAIYLLVYNLGNVFGPLGINSILAVVVVYLGGSMGVQTWLLKGFFDTIPNELDESARVDGATPAQIFWGVVLPLALPVLIVVALISFIFTLNDYVLASALLQTNDHFTLSVGMFGWVNQQYGQLWGPFCAGALMAMIPVVILFLSLQRWIVGGLTAGSVKG
ncbi:MAG TPA: sugar ABC transporter permease [Gaiellaceae bacterium]|nr:sugar ABC transporter permease [Gaiellaceae bacterium]